jgi:hypothetical protein
MRQGTTGVTEGAGAGPLPHHPAKGSQAWASRYWSLMKRTCTSSSARRSSRYWPRSASSSSTALRDDRTTAVALERWTFDADRGAEAAAVGMSQQNVSVLRPVLESAIRRLREQARR